MRRRCAKSLVVGLISVALASCSAAPTTESLQQADTRVFGLMSSTLTSAGGGSGSAYVFGGILPPDSSLPSCPNPGTARHRVTASRITGAGTPDIGPAVRSALEARGWTFGPWTSGDPAHPDYIHVSAGAQGDYRLVLTYRRGMGQTDLVVTSPCLPGQPVTHPSMFPDPPRPRPSV